MGKVIEIDDALWASLSTAARRERRTPETVIRGLIQDFLEIELDRKVDEAIGKDVRRSGYEEKDAVRLVREYRKQVRSRQARRVGEPSRGYRRAGSR
jgi:predicted transcriptional regulator